MVGRFINADGYITTGQGLNATNMFVYCLDNPVNMIDETGGVPDHILLENARKYEQGANILMCGYKNNTPNIMQSKSTSKAKKKEDWNDNPNKRKGSENRQPSGARERNVGHINGEEHSRVPKGNGTRGGNFKINYDALTGMTITTMAFVAVVINDMTGVGVTDNASLVPVTKMLWDYGQNLFK